MKIIYKNEEFYFDDKIKIKDAFKEQIENNEMIDVIAARFNNEIYSLEASLTTDGSIEFINREDKDGRNIYIRGLIFLMCKAFSELYPKALLTVNYQVTNAMYGTIDNMPVTEEMISSIKKKIQEYIDKDLPITKVMMTQEEAEEFYKKEANIRGRLQTDVKKDKVSLYYCEDYYNYFYGTMPISTGFAKYFDFVSYQKGFLIRYPSLTEPCKIQNGKFSLKLMSALEEYSEINKLLKINTVYRLNKKIKEGKFKDLVLVSEALHEKKIAEIAQKVKERGNVRMVLIAGPSSSGKTTFAGKLGMSLRVNGIKPVTISVDNYFVEREDTPKDENGNYNFECIEAIDLNLFNNQLLDLLARKRSNSSNF